MGSRAEVVCDETCREWMVSGVNGVESGLCREWMVSGVIGVERGWCRQ